MIRIGLLFARTAGWAVLLSALAATAATERRASPGSATYFVNPAAGDDAKSGLTEAEAWKSPLPLHTLPLAPGDRVELRPGHYDATLVLTGAGTAEKPIAVRFAPGDYDFRPEQATRLQLHVSNSNDDPGTPKPIAILLQDLRHAQFTGDRANVYVHGKMVEFMCDRAEDVTVSGLAFDYRRPLVSEFTILDVAERHADVEIQRDATYAIENGRFTWVGEGWRSGGTGLNQEVDPADEHRAWRRGNGPLNGVTRAEELAPFRVRFHFDKNPGFTRGRIIQCRETRRDIVAGLIRDSRDITMRDGAFHALGGMGLVHQFSENLTYERMAFAPRPGSGRTTCSWADMLHFSGCRGQIRIEGVRFSGSHDDPVNVHGTHLRITGRPAERQVLVRFMHPQTYGFPAFRAGDEIEFVNHINLRAYGTNRVAAAEMKNDRELLLTLDQPAPPGQDNDVIENVTWTPAVTIRGCHVSTDSCRGFLLTTRRPVLVESNTFVRTTMSAIDIADDANSWFESGPVRDVTIRGNRFIQCGTPVIRIMPENRTAKPEEPVHENIRILDNFFDMRNGAAIAAKSVRGLTIRGNRFSTPTLPVQTNACTEVVIEENVLNVSEQRK